MRSAGAARLAAALVLAWLAPLAGPAWAQQVGTEEVERLQTASRLEARGEIEAAERVLRTVVEERVASVPALLSLERVLRIQGRLDELVPLVRAALVDDPRSALLNQIMVRTLSALDRVGELEQAAESWIETVPRIEIAYREVAGVWESRGEYGRARAVLEEGRRRIDRANALALEMGDLYAIMEEPRLAVREWDRSIDERGRGLSQVRRRLRSLPDGGAAVVGELVDLLAGDSTATGRLNAALDLAMDATLEDRALSIAGAVLPRLDPEERQNRLGEIARQADASGQGRLAYWAYERLLDAEPERAADGRVLVLRNRLAELALELGDTASAAHRYREVEQAFAAGSPERRRAAAARIELLARQDPEAARQALVRFREEDPEGDDLDAPTAAVARALIEGGRAAEAEPLLASARGPRSTMLRARLLLERGDREEARHAYMTAASALRGVEATATLSLITLLGRISDDAAGLVGQALALEDGGEPGEAIDRVASELDGLEPAARAPLLEFTAGLADRAGLVSEARSLRRRIVADHPRSREAPAALLSLGRELAENTETRAEARELLERLVIEYPRSALVPQARRVLGRLESGEIA